MHEARQGAPRKSHRPPRNRRRPRPGLPIRSRTVKCEHVFFMSHALILNVRHGGAAAVPEGHRKFVRSGRSGKNHAVSRWLGAEVHCSTARVVSGAPANRTTAVEACKPMAALLHLSQPSRSTGRTLKRHGKPPQRKVSHGRYGATDCPSPQAVPEPENAI